MFKINGKTLKDEDGNIIIAEVNNNKTIIKYTIPRGTSAANATANPKNYTIITVYANKVYKSNTNLYKYTITLAIYHVEKLPVNITITNTNINNKLSLKVDMTDYQGNNLIGTSKIAIKINGKTLRQNNQTQFFNINNGKINLNNITILEYNKYNNITNSNRRTMRIRKSRNNNTTNINRTKNKRIIKI